MDLLIKWMLKSRAIFEEFHNENSLIKSYKIIVIKQWKENIYCVNKDKNTEHLDKFIWNILKIELTAFCQSIKIRDLYLRQKLIFFFRNLFLNRHKKT